MKRLLLLFFSILILPIEIIAENISDSPYYVSGKIIDKEDGSPVNGATIEIGGNDVIARATSNSNGEFTLQLEQLYDSPKIICIKHPKYKTVYRYIEYPRYQKYINLIVVKKPEWEKKELLCFK